MLTSIKNSEVAHLLSQIDSEYEAAHRGLSGLAQGASQHEFITKRQERIAGLYFKLGALVGDEEMQVLASPDEEIDQEQCPFEGQIDANRGGQDSELAGQLRATAHFAINPQFKEQLHARLLQQYREMMR